ncbi:hypothetical protein [Nocardioides sambongensis]|uniref:hypothetical protein n=1 Tax=Nocardioides sambongensis TaxID=2589074 RepID=UPI00112A7840|nr:hypothetical protein [Nocardioides sambongensis]
MSIKALHIPHDERPVAEVVVNERNAMSYYPYVQGGPVEGGYLSIEGLDLVCYVNSRYATLDEEMVNWRATQLFQMAGVGMFGGSIRGDALLVLGAGGGDYERSMPAELIAIFLSSDAAV